MGEWKSMLLIEERGNGKFIHYFIVGGKYRQQVMELNTTWGFSLSAATVVQCGSYL